MLLDLDCETIRYVNAAGEEKYFVDVHGMVLDRRSLEIDETEWKALFRRDCVYASKGVLGEDFLWSAWERADWVVLMVGVAGGRKELLGFATLHWQGEDNVMYIHSIGTRYYLGRRLLEVIEWYVCVQIACHGLAALAVPGSVAFYKKHGFLGTQLMRKKMMCGTVI